MEAALCVDNIQIEGRCEEIGHPLSSHAFCEAYRSCYEGSYNRYSALNNERLFVLRPAFVQRWRYIDGEPFMERFDVEKQGYELEAYVEE